MKILHSKILGEGFPFLILHGYLGMGDNWKSLANRFGKNFQIHLIDQRNHGRSLHHDDFNYNHLTEDLLAYIQYHKLKKIILLGHSMGGKTAMFFSVKFPNLVYKLIIVDISPRYYKPHHNEILKAINSIDFSIQNSRKLVDQKLAEFISEVGIRSFLLKNVYWIDKGVLAYRFNLKSLTKNSSEIGKELPLHTIFLGETIFISAGNSGYITKNDIPIIKAHFPNSSIETINNVGHWIHAEKPKIFYDLVIKFLL
tara:strand:+ start:36669 stop:37433 length:765 start_codon:yes stop_codon:yes gene_type:complete